MISNEFEQLLSIYEKAGGNKDAFSDKGIANLLIHGDKVLNVNDVEGVILKSEQKKDGVIAHLSVGKDVRVKNPIHLCFGILSREGRQEIGVNIFIEDGAEAEVLAHCVFPNAVKVLHKMDANIKIGNDAKFRYQERHYHGEFGGIKVIPNAKVSVGKESIYENIFSLLKGKVGFLDFNYEVNCSGRSITNMIAKIYGKGEDEIRIKEKVNLNGEGARSLIKTRVVLKDKARAEVIGETYGNAPYARGHVDCVEILNGKEALAKAIPIVSVKDEKAKVTHEAAIGSVDKKQMETLMARGLEEEEAIDTIVKGILR
ncbi:MAG: SufD family Fe-S cluster assembly protein [Candidatus Omnitrophica bacterium]|nr:SufD family Fe-S cluster assembly protein [Candidatus Omnitrophota bacterium]